MHPVGAPGREERNDGHCVSFRARDTRADQTYDMRYVRAEQHMRDRNKARAARQI